MTEAARISPAADEWAHRGALHEWWYLNFHLADPTGRRYGFVISFFPHYMLASLVDKDAGKVIGKKVERGLGLRSSGKGISRGSSRLVRESGDSLSLRYECEEYAVDLRLTQRKGPLYVNGSGQIREGLLGRSWYYALTNLSVEGELKLGTGTRRVDGVGWMDRQWGQWEEMGIGGWEWFSLQFSNDLEVLATQIYSPVTLKTCVRAMSVKMPGSEDLHTDRFVIRRLAEWRSPETNLLYGKRWQIAGPRGFRVGVEVDFDSQELEKGLWEGSCHATLVSEGGNAAGVGYAEQVQRNEGPVTALLSFAGAPPHYILQRALGRPNLGVWDLVGKLGVWRLASRR